MRELIGLLPAAGRGIRAYPYSRYVPKSMLQVDGVPILQRNVELMRDQLGIRDVRIVIGHHGEVIREHLGDGSDFGVQVSYIENPRIDLELPYSLYLAGQEIDGHCCMILADECYADSNHREMLAGLDPSALVTLGLIRSEYKKHIKKNYTVDVRDGWARDLIEKPSVVTSHWMGTGTYILHPDVFGRLRKAYSGGIEDGPGDWTTWLGTLARAGEKILPFELDAKYININSRDDLNYANYLIRDLRFDQRSTSLVYVVDDENEESIAGPVSRFAAEPELDEVIAVARRSSPALEKAARIENVTLCIAEDPTIGLAGLVRLGLDEARGDILLMSYSDDTFSPRDVSKLLVYLRDADMVVGTRTTRQMIEQGTNMRGVVRIAQVLLAKLLQLLWWRFDSRFTDVGCVYRGLWRSTWVTIRDHLTANGVEVFPEMMLADRA
ncbi:MAG: glycosyltransferase [Deltaproteobacteria bacterium]|nr:glycosyltransferase [Deltaproteobacteria bacterium]